MADEDRQTFCQVTEDCQSPAGSPGTESLEDIIRKLLPAHPAPAASEGDPYSVGPGATHSAFTGSDTATTAGGTGTVEVDGFGNHVTDLASGRNSHGRGRRFCPDSLSGCFSCGVWTHTTDQCQTLDESFPFLPTGWQADHVGDKFILGPGPAGPEPTEGKRRLIRGEGLVAWISNDYEPQLSVVGEDIPGLAVPNYLVTARSSETWIGGLRWLSVVFDCLAQIRMIQNMMCCQLGFCGL